MNRLDHLYEQMILEHNKNPRGFYTFDPHTHYCHGHNPLCGDDFKVSLNVVDNKIEDIGFIGSGCAFLNLITKDDIPVDTSLGKLKVFEGVKRFPVRVKCAALTWRALENALQDEDKETKISTE